MLFLLAIVISGGLIAIGWVIYMEDFVMTREFHMPETDTEKKGTQQTDRANNHSKQINKKQSKNSQHQKQVKPE